MKNLYNAGSMFNEAQIAQRKLEGINLRRELPNITINNPIDFDTNVGNNPSPLQIWDMDYEKVSKSEFVIFELDSFDDGTTMEFAISVEQAKTSQPNKFLVAVISDFRYHQLHDVRHMPEFAINHFVYGALFDTQLVKEKRIYAAKSHNDAIEMIKNRELFLETNDEKYIKANDTMNITNIYDNGKRFK
ncbi:hypothetical protein [Mesoplasma photuris]|uniref:hypothetical protein n=1 Tax=Mesoplasma photuris TaxID=217731 RepID=UPI00068E0BCA|nr:hypothetical protein [Mesoplasma photuris]